MADGRQMQDWDLLAYLCHIIANCHSAGKKFKPKDFNPYQYGQMNDSKVPMTAENIMAMKSAFMKMKKR
jgi:hypothetical protein